MKGESLSARIAALAPEQRQLLEVRLNKQTFDLSQIPITPKRNQRGYYPLSFAQQRLWFLDQLEPGNPFYNVPAAVRLTGHLDVSALEQSFSEIIRRHEALRTTFSVVEGSPVQVINAAQPLTLEVSIDLHELPEAERAMEVSRLAREEARRAFDLAHGPLLRAILLRLAEDEHVLLLTMHHIISDGWSVGLLIREMTLLYEAISTGKPSSLPELPIQYVDFAQWQHEWLQGDVLETQLSYWKQQLAGAPAMLNLPADRPRPAVQSHRGAVLSFVLDDGLIEALKSLSRREGATLFMTLLAAFKVLLYKYTSQSDIIVGAPIANRNRIEIENSIGFFVNTLVYRTRLSVNASFLHLLRQVRDNSVASYAHQDLPFEKLVEELQPERDLSYSPLFQVMFVMQNAPGEKLKVPGLELSVLQTETSTAKFDLRLAIEKPYSNGILEYNTDLFDEQTIRRMIGHYETLLRAIVENPQQPLSALPLLSESEQYQLLEEWNETRAAYPRELCVHELFEAQVERTPDAIAVVFEEEEVSYAELNRRANQLAHYLRGLGVGAETLVGLALERSVEMVVGMLGVLKAGGGYVPLEASYPRERLRFMLEDTGLRVLVTQARLMERLPEHKAAVVCVDTEWEVIEGESGENLKSEVTAENLAYVIYTSGSTGQPKGVLINHQGVVNRLLWMQATYHLSAADRVLQKTPYSFDVSVWEFFWPLLTGARLIVAQPGGHQDRDYLMRLIGAQGVTTVHFVPSMLRVFLEGEVAQQCGSVRRVICSGEELTAELVEKFYREWGAELENLYGPTEASIDVTYWACREAGEKERVLIGRPIANTEIYILDADLNPTPVGVAGELYIGGDGLARGYLRRPGLTAEKFIPHPFARTEGARLYRTGDRARYQADGNIEYLGRLDEQVKVRGYRIELGEIEAALREHQAVKDAIVLKIDDKQESRLVAYVLPDTQHEALTRQMFGENLRVEHIAQWQTVFNEIYSDTSTINKQPPDIRGWNSSYTGLPIPPEEMYDWVDRTVERILALHPQHILEIGCGTGLLLTRIAPHCASYLGTDFSAESLSFVEQQLEALHLRHVKLLQMRAEDFQPTEREVFDMAILNSVVQYFPSVDYLLGVLENVVNSVSKEGFIFLGDIRSLPLLEVFHLSVQLHQASSSLPTTSLLQRVKKRMLQENELVLDPSFFLALKQRLPRISHVEIKPKGGYYHNELTQFRYDVILYMSADVDRTVDFPAMDWQEQELTLPVIRQLLEEKQPEILAVTNVPNARLAVEMRAIEHLARPNPPATVGELRSELEKNHDVPGMEPEAFRSLSDEVPYKIDLSWLSSRANGSFDVVFKRRHATGENHRPAVSFNEEEHDLRPWSSYANNPLRRKVDSQLVSELRAYLKKKLPEYMMPSAFVRLEHWPLTPNGKLDRDALPEPERETVSDIYSAPRNDTEALLASIWAEVLQMERVSIHDNFFTLGGHSLLGTQIISRVRDSFQVELPLRSLFESPTVAELTEVIEAARLEQHEDIEKISRILERLEQFSEDNVQTLLNTGENQEA